MGSTHLWHAGLAMASSPHVGVAGYRQVVGMAPLLMHLGVSYRSHDTHATGRLLLVAELAKQRGRGCVAKLRAAESARRCTPTLDVLKVHERRLLAYAVGRVPRRWCRRLKGQALTQWCVVTLRWRCLATRADILMLHNGDPGARTTQT